MTTALRTPELDAPPLRRYGLPELVFGASPAANTDFTAALSGSFYGRLISVFFNFATDATVADREVVLAYETGAGQRFFVNGAPVEVTASDDVDYCFSSFHDEAVWPVDDSIIVPLAPILLRPTDVFRIHLVNGQTADALTTIRYVWERFYSDVELV